MANFNDLPKDVRERIYRLHLVQDKPITILQHNNLVHYAHSSTTNGSRQRMPPIMTLSKEIEKEAAPFYYGENHFESATSWGLNGITYYTWPRHLKLIRKVTITWDETSRGACYMFDDVKKMKGVEELYIHTNEREMILRRLRTRKKNDRFAWSGDAELTPQQQLTILTHPGMTGLQKLSGIRHVEFLKKTKKDGEEYGGPIPGGVLETQIAPRIMDQKSSAPPKIKKTNKSSSFDFLALSPELRNRIYDLLLVFPGPIQPTNQLPSSAPKKGKAPASALAILAVSRQIHNEAVGIFYHYNAFTFQWTTHLHCFLQSLGTQRKSFIRDLTIHYIDVKSGGISLVELTFPMLKQLTGLKKLKVIMHGELAHKVRQRWWGATTASIKSANPAMIPGLKMLFELRGIEDVSIRDEVLETRYEELKKKSEYPDFRDGTSNAGNLKVYKALEHFSQALQVAQNGLVCEEVLEDGQWHTRDEFPELPCEDEGEEAGDAEGDGEESEEMSSEGYMPSMELGELVE